MGKIENLKVEFVLFVLVRVKNNLVFFFGVCMCFEGQNLAVSITLRNKNDSKTETSNPRIFE